LPEQAGPQGSLSETRTENYSAIEKAGGQVRYEPFDVSDVNRVRKCIANAEAQWHQPLAGIFHLAGSLAGSETLKEHWERADGHLVTTESIESFESIFRSKVYGTCALFEAIQDRPDTLFVAFSSVNGLFGGNSFSAYSAANAFLDNFCLDKRYRSHPRIFCFNWSMWNDLGMNKGRPEYERELALNMGYQSIGKEQGINSMLAGLRRRQPQLIVGLDGISSHLRPYLDTEVTSLSQLTAYYVCKDGVVSNNRVEQLFREWQPDSTHCRCVAIDAMPLTEAGEIDRGKLQIMNQKPTDQGGRARELSAIELKIAQLWREELNLPQVTIADSFFELGGDSLIAVRLVNRIRDAFGVRLPVRALFEMPTIPQLAMALTGRLEEADADPRFAEQSRPRSPLELLERIDGISEEQVDALLEEMAGEESIT
jgi:acyl carrier protein